MHLKLLIKPRTLGNRFFWYKADGEHKADIVILTLGGIFEKHKSKKNVQELYIITS